MKAITLWQPWAWALIHGGKDVENRVWRTHYRGPLIIHAAKRKPTSDELWSVLETAEAIETFGEHMHWATQMAPALRAVMGNPDALRAACQLGGVIGRVDVVDCMQGHSSPWAFDDQWQWVVRNPVALPFRRYKGQMGFFEIPEPGAVPKSEDSK